jgi:hypothetical protein
MQQVYQQQLQQQRTVRFINQKILLIFYS